MRTRFVLAFALLLTTSSLAHASIVPWMSGTFTTSNIYTFSEDTIGPGGHLEFSLVVNVNPTPPPFLGTGDVTISNAVNHVVLESFTAHLFGFNGNYELTGPGKNFDILIDGTEDAPGSLAGTVMVTTTSPEPGTLLTLGSSLLPAFFFIHKRMLARN